MKIKLEDLRYNENNGGEIWFMYDTKIYKLSRNLALLPEDVIKYLYLHDNGVEINLNECEEAEIGVIEA